MATATQDKLLSFVCELKEGKQRISKLKKLNEQLESKANLQEFWDISPDLFAVMTPCGYLVAVNDAWTQALGYTKQELLNKSWLDMISQDDLSKTYDAVKVLNKTDIVRFVNKCIRKDGSELLLEYSIKKIVDGRCYVIARVVDSAIIEAAEKYDAKVYHDTKLR